MGLFGKKKIQEDIVAPPTLGPPTDRVMKMRKQGYTDNQIVQGLQKENYTSTQIFDALSQADIQKTPPGAMPGQMPQQPMPEPQQPMPQQPMPQQPMPQQQMPQQLPEQYPEQPMPQPSFQQPLAQMGREQVEEVAEAIIDEKWEELMKGVNKIIAWKDETEEKLTKLQEELEDLKHRFSELHTGVLGRIAEYDKGIRDVGTDVKAMQEVFKKALPKFTENVATLERLAKKKKIK